MLPGSICLPHAQPQSQATVQARMREIKVPAAVKAFHQSLIAVISPVVAEAYQVQGRRRGHLKAAVAPDPPGKLLRQSTCRRM